MGNSDQGLGSARYAGPDRRFRPALVGEERDQRRTVYPMARHPGHDARQDFSALPSIEWQNQTLAQVPQRGAHPPRHAAFFRRCAAFGAGLRGALQQRAFEQRHRIHHAEGHARRASAGDSRRARSEAGGSAETAADSAQRGRHLSKWLLPQVSGCRVRQLSLREGAFVDATSFSMKRVRPDYSRCRRVIRVVNAADMGPARRQPLFVPDRSARKPRLQKSPASWEWCSLGSVARAPSSGPNSARPPTPTADPPYSKTCPSA